MSEQTLMLDPMDFGCEQAKVVSVHVQPGQSSLEGESLVEFECDKASFELSMPCDGIVNAILVDIGDLIVGGAEIARISAKVPNSKTTDHVQPVGELAERYPMVGSAASLKEAVQILNQAVKVTAATRSDAPSIAKIYAESALTASTGQAPVLDDQCIAWFERALDQPNKLYWKCELESGVGTPEVIGHCNIERVERTPEISYHFIGVYVAAPSLPWTPAVTLVSEALKYCENNQIKRLIAVTHATNHSAIRLLASTGFKEIGSVADINYQDGSSRVFEMEIG